MMNTCIVKVSPFGIFTFASAHISHIEYMRNLSGAGAERCGKIPKGEIFTVCFSTTSESGWSKLSNVTKKVDIHDHRYNS